MLRRLFLKHWEFKLILALALLGSGVWGWFFAQQTSATLLAIDTQTGKIRWFQPLRSSEDFYSTGAIASDDTVILRSAESSLPEKRLDTYQLQAFDAQSGDRLWRNSMSPFAAEGAVGMGYWFASNPTIELQGSVLYAQIEDQLRSLEARTGQERWAMKRPWFNFNEARVYYGLGIAPVGNQLAVLNRQARQRQIQVLEINTGKVLRESTLPLGENTVTRDRITANDRDLFLETNELIPIDKTSFRDSDRSTLITYDLNRGQVRSRTPILGGINQLQAVGNTVQLSLEAIYDPKAQKIQSEARLLALDPQTGRELWQRSRTQLNCFDFVRSWRVDANSIYLTCNRRQGKRESSTVMALSAETGKTQWETLISPTRFARDLPSVISDRALLTFRQIEQGNQQQTQAIALDRQTGKLLWTTALFSDRHVNAFRATAATSQDNFFVLDSIPRWQLWLLQLDRHWYFKQPLT